MNENFLTTEDGVRLFYQKLGDGPKTIVIPNGLYFLHDFAPLARDRTLIAYDPRNRGQSDSVPGNIRQDVEDLDAVRQHFGIERVDLIGHSYMGLMVVLYAMTFPASVNRTVQIGPMGPVAGKKYPPQLAYADGLVAEVFAKLAQMQKERQPGDDVEFCRKICSVLASIYVTNPADANKADWGRCHLPNELNFLKYWTGTLLPSILRLVLTVEEVKKATNPVLTIHGRKDRSAPYGGARDWALMLTDARLVTVEDAAHAPWIEAPEAVFGSMETFFGGAWPDVAERMCQQDDEEAILP